MQSQFLVACTRFFFKPYCRSAVEFRISAVAGFPKFTKRVIAAKSHCRRKTLSAIVRLRVGRKKIHLIAFQAPEIRAIAEFVEIARHGGDYSPAVPGCVTAVSHCQPLAWRLRQIAVTEPECAMKSVTEKSGISAGAGVR